MGKDRQSAGQQQMILATSHIRDMNYRIVKLAIAYAIASQTTDRTLFEVSHSHPDAVGYMPSGFRGDGTPHDLTGDRKLAQDIESIYTKNRVWFGMYVAPTNRWVYYNSKEAKRD